MANRHFYNLVRQAVDLGAKTISIFGFGEPLLDEELPAKIKYCTDRGLETFITTNGSLLDPEKARQVINAGLSHIRFSIHGLFAPDFEDVHRGLRFPIVIRNVMNFLARKKSGRHKTFPKTSVSVIPLHNEDPEIIRKFWEPLVDWLEIWRPHNWTNARPYRSLNRRKKTCGRPFNGPIQVNADGKVMVCCFDFNAEMTVGNTYEDLLENIIKGKKFNEVRRKHTDGDLDGLPCFACDQLNIEEESPLLYSNRDPEKKAGCTSSTKFCLNDNCDPAISGVSAV